MKKIILVSGIVLLVLIVVAGVTMWYFMQQPLYQPGMVRAMQNLTPPAQTGEADFWAVEPDIKLYHFSQGAGRNVLIIHGGPGYPFQQPLAGLKPLTDRYKFHYYDQRGCGQSTRPIDKFTSSNYYENMSTLDRTLGLGAQIADIERIRQILGDDQLILIGHSFGGFLAALYAAEFPEHVAALILVAPADTLVMPPSTGGLFDEVKQLLPTDMQAEYDIFLKNYLDYGSIFSKSEADLVALNGEFAKYYMAVLKAKGVTLPDEQESIQNGGGWMVHAMYFSMGLKHDYRSALNKVIVPTLVLHGDQDLQPVAVEQMYVSALPSARLEVIQNAGHFSFDEQPEAFATALEGFLTEVK